PDGYDPCGMRRSICGTSLSQNPYSQRYKQEGGRDTHQKQTWKQLWADGDRGKEIPCLNLCQEGNGTVVSQCQANCQLPPAPARGQDQRDNKGQINKGYDKQTACG